MVRATYGWWLEVYGDFCEMKTHQSSGSIELADFGLLRMCIADDNEDDVDLVRESIDGVQGVRLGDAFKNGLELVDALQGYLDRDEPLPDLIFVDLNMPIMNGFEVLREARKRRVFDGVAFVLFTSSIRSEDMDFSYKSGANMFVQKPMEFREMRKTVRAIIDFYVLQKRRGGD